MGKARLADIGDACSLYDEYPLRIETWFCGKWYPESNWHESEMEKSFRRVKLLEENECTVRLIRIRFEVIEINA